MFYKIVFVSYFSPLTKCYEMVKKTFFTNLRIFSLILGKSNTFFFTFDKTKEENIDKKFKK